VTIGPFEKDANGNEIKEFIPLNAENLLLRGCMLRNTDFVYGIVVFTGHYTKIMQNSASPKYKFSALELKTSTSIFLILLMQICFALTSGLIGGSWITAF
jgi:magnesium-transporting ATPase (P-type)